MIRLSATNVSILAWSADANISVEAPCSICIRNICEPAKLKCTFTPGFAFSYPSPISSNAPVNDDAANTVRLCSAGLVDCSAVCTTGGLDWLTSAPGCKPTPIVLQPVKDRIMIKMKTPSHLFTIYSSGLHGSQ